MSKYDKLETNAAGRIVPTVINILKSSEKGEEKLLPPIWVCLFLEGSHSIPNW